VEFDSAIAFALEQLRFKLPTELYYHSYEHTVRVMENAKLIAEAEKVKGQDLNEILLAAAFHDIGFLQTTEEHEQAGCKVVEEVLPGYNFSSEQIVRIQGMIRATKIPQSPQTNQEEILCDADLAYLASPRYAEIASHLFKELQVLGRIKSEKDWQRLQIDFFNQHQYFTNFGRLSFQAGKDKNRRKLLDAL